MNRVPIAFAFDNNLVMPACVCISSLMMNASEDTFYDIFILYPRATGLNRDMLDRLPLHYPNCKISYREVDDTFASAFEIRGITTPAYYRLLIPELIPEYDTVVYSDVDIIFRMDLSDLYRNVGIQEYYIAATHDMGLNFGDDGRKHIAMLGIESGKYLQSGFIVLNSKKLREDGCLGRFKAEAKKNYKYQDQDILNVVCRGKVLYLPPVYNVTDFSAYFMMRDRNGLGGFFTDAELDAAAKGGNIHYNGHKPWKKYSVNFDIWWEYYRKSPFFDEKFYFDFFYGKLNVLDQLSLWKRIKILARYFIHGRK